MCFLVEDHEEAFKTYERQHFIDNYFRLMTLVDLVDLIAISATVNIFHYIVSRSSPLSLLEELLIIGFQSELVVRSSL